MTTEFESALRKKFSQWARETTEEAKRILGTKYGKYVKVSSRTKEDTGRRLYIEITAENIETREEWGIVNVAGTFEYGSGVHGKKKRKYKIKPRLKKVLAFYWEKFDPDVDFPPSQKIVGVSDDGRILFRWVDHPGSKAINGGRGYMRPALDKTRRKIRKELGPEVRKAVVGTMRRSLGKK